MTLKEAIQTICSNPSDLKAILIGIGVVCIVIIITGLLGKWSKML